ncbi:hypothetical protein WB841_002840 [Vibrio vulnificus]
MKLSYKNWMMVHTIANPPLTISVHFPLSFGKMAYSITKPTATYFI